ncbi:MAG: FAD-dependent oxidoreductase, partial [Candidatus Colwellbacteria bacterium]|nr:FAD-dependent oxidoreductase [Candidatus Colwellbacteria bacterium]
LGAETNFFDIPGLKENALELKSFNNALEVRDAIWGRVEAATPEEAVDIVIGGGGSTGVELAGEVREWIAQMRKEGHLCRTSVTLVDASLTILKGFEEKIIRQATNRLKKIGTNFLLEERVVKVSDGKVFLESGRIVAYDILIWTGGVKANSIVDKLPFKKEAQGRINVGGELLCVAEKPRKARKDFVHGPRGKVYGIGDIVCVHDGDGRPVPMVARAAIIQGDIAAKNILVDIKGGSHLKYNPKDYPYIIPIGGKYAIAKIGPLTISGFLGWVLKGLVELNYLFSIMPNVRALKIWIRGLKIFIQNDRLG